MKLRIGILVILSNPLHLIAELLYAKTALLQPISIYLGLAKNLYLYSHIKIIAENLFRQLCAILLVSLTVASCNQASHSLPPASKHFDSILIVAEAAFDSGFSKKAMELAATGHRSIPKKTVSDDINYYAFCSGMYRRDPPDYDKLLAYSDSLNITLEKNNLTTVAPDRYIMGLNRKADALFAKGQYTEAYDYYYKAKKIAKDNGDFCSLSNYSHSLGMALYRQQKYLLAARRFMESYEESSGCPADFTTFYHRQELLDNIGLSYTHAHKYDSAMLYYNKALSFVNENVAKFDKNEKFFISAKAVIIGNMADVYIALKNADTAISLLKQSISINLQKGYVNSDALTDHIKLANLYYQIGDIGELRTTLNLIKAELDSIPDKTASLNWQKLMWNLHDAEKDTLQAYRHLYAYEKQRDSMVATISALLATDFDGRIHSMERQYQIALLNKNSKTTKIYLFVAGLVTIMALAIVGLIWRSARRARKNVASLTALNKQINDQKDQLISTLNELEIKDRDKTRILRSVAHDVMNPIAAIMALTDILRADLGEISDDNQNIIALIKEACTNSLTLSKEILEAAVKIDKAKLVKEPLEIDKLAANCVDLLNRTAAVKNQSISIQTEQNNLVVNANKEQIWRILNNLIANAIKFSYPNTEIGVAVRKTDKYVRISVKDQGIGIPEKNKGMVFDMFTEAKNVGTAGETPHGLGLSISLQIAKAHNGNIWLESQEGVGTTFYLDLPLAG